MRSRTLYLRVCSIFAAAAVCWLGGPAEVVSQTTISTGVDTILASSGLNGPDTPHGAAGQNPDGIERWEWDGSDGGDATANQGLLWFDIPQEVLDGFDAGRSTAILRLHIDDPGDSANVHRITSDWLSGANGGDNATWNNFPDGPGVIPGTNSELNSSFATGAVTGGTDVDLDVATDILAWAAGAPNYGWAFIPTGGNGAGIISFENTTDPVPQLIFTNLVASNADVNGDGVVDLLDFDIIRANFLTGTLPSEGDLTRDGTVDLDDFGFWKAEFIPGGAPAAVPEPAALGLLLMGAAALAFARRRKAG